MQIKASVLKRLVTEAIGNAYQVLGVGPEATDFEIRKAWRALALQYRSERQMGDPHAYAKIADVTRAKNALLRTPGDRGTGEYEGYEGASAKMPAEKQPRGPGIARKSKESYKIYPWKEKRQVVRVGGKVYGTEPGGALPGGGTTRFKGGDRAKVGLNPSGKMGITSTQDDHTQEWDPIDQVDEVRKVLDVLVIEMFSRIGR